MLFGIKLGNWKGLMLDEIINYVQSLQNQVVVNVSASLSSSDVTCFSHLFFSQSFLKEHTHTYYVE